MVCDSEDYDMRDPEKLRKLAAEITECIIGAMIGEPAGDSSVTGRRVCPPNKLCCWSGYSCTVPFYCDEYFGCIDRFSVDTFMPPSI